MHPIKVLFLVDGSFFIGISKIGFRFKLKADQRFEPQAYIEYVEDLKRGPNADIGLEDIFET